MQGGMSQRDFKFFLKIVGKEIGDKIIANKMPVDQLCKLDSSFLKVLFNLDDDGLKELRDSFDWILEKVYKQPVPSSQPCLTKTEVVSSHIKTSSPVIVKKKSSLNGEDRDTEAEKELEELVKGCGKIIPNDIPEGEKECYSWFFTDGKWQNWKTESSIFWRYGCNWGGEGTTCGYVYPDGANFCKDCGNKLEKLHRKLYN